MGCDSSCDFCCLERNLNFKTLYLSNHVSSHPHTFTFTPSPRKENKNTEKNRTQLPHPNIPQDTPTIKTPPPLPPHVYPQLTIEALQGPLKAALSHEAETSDSPSALSAVKRGEVRVRVMDGWGGMDGWNYRKITKYKNGRCVSQKCC